MSAGGPMEYQQLSGVDRRSLAEAHLKDLEAQHFRAHLQAVMNRHNADVLSAIDVPRAQNFGRIADEMEATVAAMARAIVKLREVFKDDLTFEPPKPPEPEAK